MVEPDIRVRLVDETHLIVVPDADIMRLFLNLAQAAANQAEAALADISTALATKLSVAGGMMAGALGMDGNRITGLPAPDGADQPARLFEVAGLENEILTLLTGLLAKTGGTMTGSISMGGAHRITQLPEPNGADQPARLQEILNVLTTIENLGAALYGDGPNPDLNSFRDVATALLDNPNFGADVAASFAAERAATVADVSAEAAARSSLIRSSGPVADRLLDLLDANGFRRGGLTTTSLDLPGLSIVQGPEGELQFLDKTGRFVKARLGAVASLLSGLEITQEADGTPTLSSGRGKSGVGLNGLTFVADGQPDPVFTDRNGFVRLRLGETTEAAEEELIAVDITPYFSSVLCGVAGEELTLYPRALLSVRSDTDSIRATIASDNGYIRTGADQVVFQPDRLAATASLTVRGPTADIRASLPLNVRTAPKASGVATKILLIGDSILNRQAGVLIDANLTAWGYLPTWLGTLPGHAGATGGGDADGKLGEAREGWESGDFTFAITDRALPIAPGGEAAYLALSKTAKRDYNPFIRAAVGGDDPALVRNGYILDFAFYQSRFGLLTPDVVIWNAGTNDVRDRTPEAVGTGLLANEALFLSRIRTAWPDCRIIRMMPGTPREPSRDALWTPEYIPVIRAIQQAAVSLADPHLTLAPTWAMVTEEIGYAYAPADPDPVTGATKAGLSDPIHPMGPARAQLFHVVAGYVACAASNLI